MAASGRDQTFLAGPKLSSRAGSPVVAGELLVGCAGEVFFYQMRSSYWETGRFRPVLIMASGSLASLP